MLIVLEAILLVVETLRESFAENHKAFIVRHVYAFL